MRSMRGPLVFALLLVLAGLNLRPAITSISTVVDEIRHAYGLTNADVSVLVALPVLCLGLGAPLIPRLSERLGLERSFLLGLLLIGAGVGARVGNAVLLIVGTVVCAAGICAVSVLLPSVVKRYSPGRAAEWTALYTTALTLGAAGGAGLTVHALERSGSIAMSLAAWAVPAALALTVWAPRIRRQSASDTPTTTRWAHLHTRPLAWAVTGYFGVQALIFFALVAWLPTLYQDRGASALTAAGLLSVMSLAGVPASLITPLIAAQLARQRLLALVVAGLTFAGLVGVLAAPLEQAWLWVALLGVAQSSAFSLALTLVVLRAHDYATATGLSSMSQFYGYVLAAAGPWGLGLLRAYAETWAPAVGILLGATLVEAMLGWHAGSGLLPARKPEETSEEARITNPSVTSRADTS